ncbi:unnamed protein product [Fusarium venenatum]|uniref:Uncharacterized protein n=1 Tax=Fusarium venenatum TaxID=56646 RepID=A0A2L2TUQ2_9HYPO|nr:uncharacterized protein FVRRES_00507 [Fusarium venenatum]CEI63995.1 unnamed protein product [Fusarium venenatum]
MDIASLIEYSTWTLQRPLAPANDQHQNTANEPNETNNISSPTVRTLKYTLPTWFRHSLAVHVVDFRASHNDEGDRGDIPSAVIQLLGTHHLLIEEEPDDWYIDDRGVFQERGRDQTVVQDTIYCGISTIVKRKSDG